MTDTLLVYGSYGYTGDLVARTAVERGLDPILAGRRAERVEPQAIDLDCEPRVFSLEHPEVIDQQLADVNVVLNCAGPFSRTADPLVSACLRTDTHYLDITGEIEVIEGIAARDEAASAADITLLPAVGFDVVPTDCLAAYLAAQLPTATRLELAIAGMGSASPGTLKSMIEGLSMPGAIRQDGRIRPVRAAWKTRQVDFGRGPTSTVTIPWGDVATAYHTTGIPNVEVYAAVPERAIAALRRADALTSVLGSRTVQRVLEWLVDVTVSGPSEVERAKTVVAVWGAVEDEDGERAVARLQVPDPYGLTAEAAVEAARRILQGTVDSGFQTPGSAFGPDFVLAFEGVEREDVTPSVEAVPTGGEGD